MYINVFDLKFDTSKRIKLIINKIMLIICITYPAITAIRKVKAGITSVIAEARIGLLYPIPKYHNIWTEQLKKKLNP